MIYTHSSSIVLGGQETTSGAMSRLLDLMTLTPSLQEWLREEIVEALAVRIRERCIEILLTLASPFSLQKKNGEPLDFYELNALPRLDATCREALRLFAPVTFVWRQYEPLLSHQPIPQC